MMRFYPSSTSPLSLRALLHTGLTVLIIGAGAGSRVNTARADDVFTPFAQENAGQEKAAQTDRAKAESKEQQDRAKTDANDEKVRQELDALLKERAKLDDRIAATREKLSAKGRLSERTRRLGGNGPIVEVRPGQRPFIFRQGIIQGDIDEAMKQAQKAMEEALKNNKGRVFVVPPANAEVNEAMKQAQKALEEALKQNNARTFVVPPFHIDPGQNRAFRFFWNGKEWQGDGLKDGKPGEIPAETLQKMKSLQQRLEQRMKEMEERINKAFEGRETPKSKAPGKEEKKDGGKDKGEGNPVFLDA